MNYDEARQLGPDEPEASGKWNWTTMNDGAIRTAPPCAYPDFEWPEHFDPLNPPTPTGRPRCDHDSREDAELHYWDDQVSRVRILALDLDAIRERRRCAFDDGEWETHRASWPGGYVVDSLCERHAYPGHVRSLHPFVSGMRVIHS
jgi:hypothetical protein